MELILDGESYGEELNLEELPGKIQEYIDKMNLEGRLVKNAYINGKSASGLVKNPEAIKDVAKEQEVERIELVSVTQEELVDETLETITGYISNVKEYTHKLAHSIQSGDIPDKDSLLQLTDGLEWIFQASNGLIITLQDSELKEKVDDLQDTFGEILKSLKNEDYKSFGDILDNELGDKLEGLRKYFGEKIQVRKVDE